MKKIDDKDGGAPLAPKAEIEWQSERDTRIVLVDSSNQPAIIIQASQDFEAYEAGLQTGASIATAARLGSMLQAAPSVLAAGEASGKQLMEVVVNGNLVRAADGNGYRAFTMGPKGVKEHARLFESERLQNVLNAGAVWQVASVIVAQKHLADISRKLDTIAKGVRSLSNFINDQRRARIEAAYRYLEQARSTLEAGEISSSVRTELESCERNLLETETHLHKEIKGGLATAVQDEERIGTDDLAMGIARKIRDQEALLRDLALCIRTRICAWHVLSLFPGEPRLKEARRIDLQRTIRDFAALSPAFENAIKREIANMSSFFNPESTLKRRRDALEKQAGDTMLKIKNTHMAADRMIDDTNELLIRHDAPVRMLLQYRDGVLVGVSQGTCAASPA
ncbi:MAG: hypothetical protein ABWY27_19790 [Telluria sp.]